MIFDNSEFKLHLETHLIEINLEKRGTTHPFWTAKSALGAVVCETTGKFILTNGRKRIYHSNDNLFPKDKTRNRSLKSLLSKMNECRDLSMTKNHKR